MDQIEELYHINGRRFTCDNIINIDQQNEYRECSTFRSFDCKSKKNSINESSNSLYNLKYKQFSPERTFNRNEKRNSFNKDNSLNLINESENIYHTPENEAIKLLLSIKQESSNDNFNQTNTYPREIKSFNLSDNLINNQKNFNCFETLLSTRNSNTSKSKSKFELTSNLITFENTSFDSFRQISTSNNQNQSRNLKNQHKRIIFNDNNNIYNTHCNIGKELFLIKKEVKGKELKIQSLKNKISKLKNLNLKEISNSNDNNDKDLNIKRNIVRNKFNSIEYNINNDNETKDSNKKVKMEYTSDREKIQNPVFTNLSHKDLIKKYKSKIKEEEDIKKNELLLEKIKRKDYFIYSQIEKVKEKKREYISNKIKSKAIEEVINKNSKIDIIRKLKITSTNKMENRYLIDEVKRDKNKNDSKNENVVKKIEEEIIKIHNLEETIKKLKDEEELILKSNISNSSLFINNRLEFDEDIIKGKNNINMNINNNININTNKLSKSYQKASISLKKDPIKNIKGNIKDIKIKTKEVNLINITNSKK